VTSPGVGGRGKPGLLTRRTVPSATGDRRLSVCLYSPSMDPSGMGSHMVDLAAEYLPGVEVSVLCWGTAAGRRVLDRAAAVGATTLPLPHPRAPDFADTIVDFLLQHPPDVFHVHVGSGREDFDGARAARRAGVHAVVQTQHQPWLYRHPREQARFRRAIAPVDLLIAVSRAEQRTYERIGVTAGQMVTVANGIVPRERGPGRRAARRALGLDADQLVVLTVGRLMRQKGHEYLVAAVPELLQRFPELAVVVFGGGHLREQLLRQAEDAGVAGCVHLVGYRPDARMLLDAADVFVLPSLQEGMPLAALEAMDASLPVVATDVIGTAEVVDDGRTGLLVPPGDPSALAGALARLLADPALRVRLGQAGNGCYRARFTAARMAAETLAAYGQALARPRVGHPGARVRAVGPPAGALGHRTGAHLVSPDAR
jgi:glycosyltransferase involved in cell wall biosynthesis